MDNLINDRKAEKKEPEEKGKVITKDIEIIQNDIKELEKATIKDEPSIKAKKIEIENKKKELTVINNNLDKKLQSLNDIYEKKVKEFKEGTTIKVGGRLIRRTRKRRLQKKPSKRYILSKNKIKKVKSSRYRKKKYTLRKR